MISDAIVRTNYPSLRSTIDVLIAECCSGDYAHCVDLLTKYVQRYFPCLRLETNPVISILPDTDEDDLSFLIQEYSAFSNAAIHMFFEARIRNHWPALRDEISRNLDEELGQLTNAVPHLELMRYGYRVELGIETDDLHHTASTVDFIEKMNCLFRQGDNAYLGGVLLAFEGVAVEEFRIVAQLLQRRQELMSIALDERSLTKQYVKGHVTVDSAHNDVDPELGHFQGMIDAVGAGVRGEPSEFLARGFFAVCLELSRWWEQLAAETVQRKIRRRLNFRAASQELYLNLVRR